MAFMEIDQIAVPVETMKRIRGGDKETLAKLRQELNGITLYEHNLTLDPPGAYEKLSLRAAHDLGIIDCVVIADNQEKRS